MKNLFVITLIFATIGARAEELWKGATPPSKIQATVMSGFGLYGISGGFSLVGGIAAVVKDSGFLEDVNDQTLVEFKIGPTVFSSGTGTQYNLSMRWDFIMDTFWKFSASGGLGGFMLPSALGGVMYNYPYLALGAQYCFDTKFSLRGEVGSNFIGGGINYSF